MGNEPKLNSRRIARMRYAEEVPMRLMRVEVYKEITRFFQAGRVPVEMQREVAELIIADLDDQETRVDWESDYRTRHGLDPRDN